MLQLIHCWRTYLWCSRMNRPDVLYQLNCELNGYLKRKGKALRTVFSIFFQTPGSGGQFVRLGRRGEERREGKERRGREVKWRCIWVGPAKESRMGEQVCAQRHAEPRSHPHPTRAQKGTFITLNDSSWAGGKHLFQSLSRNRTTISVHQRTASNQLSQTEPCFVTGSGVMWSQLAPRSQQHPRAQDTSTRQPSKSKERFHCEWEQPSHLQRGGRRGVGYMKILLASCCRCQKPVFRPRWVLVLSPDLARTEGFVPLLGKNVGKMWSCKFLRRLSWPPTSSPREMVACQ